MFSFPHEIKGILRSYRKDRYRKRKKKKKGQIHQISGSEKHSIDSKLRLSGGSASDFYFCTLLVESTSCSGTETPFHCILQGKVKYMYNETYSKFLRMKFTQWSRPRGKKWSHIEMELFSGLLEDTESSKFKHQVWTKIQSLELQVSRRIRVLTWRWSDINYIGWIHFDEA